MRTVKILSVLAGAVVVVAAGLFALWLSVNPNDYKEQIAAAVKQSTGRDLSLTGRMHLSVFPWVALELGPGSLGNPPGFGEGDFLAFNHAAVRVRLLPLLAKRLEMERVDIDGLDLRLSRNAAGMGNWEGFGWTQKPERGAGAGVEAGAGAGDGAVGSLRGLDGIRVTHGRVSYQGMVIENLTVDTGAFGGHGVTPVSVALQANRGVPGENLSLNARFDLGADAQYQRLRLEAVNFSGTLGRPGDGPPAHWEWSAPVIEADVSGQTVAVPAFAMSYSSARVTGKLQAIKIFDDLSMTGSVALEPLVLHEFAPRVGIVLPRTRDPRVLAQLSATSGFSYDAQGVRLDTLQAQLDDTHVQGSVALVGEPRALKFDLTVDRIDLDRYLSADNGSSEPTAAGATPGSAAGAVQAGDAARSPADARMPDADGIVSVGSMRLSKLDFSNVRVTVAAQDRVLHLFPSLAQIDGGNYSGDITLDERDATPVWSLDEHLSGVDMARLLAGSGNEGRLTGRGTVNIRGTARGAGLDAVMRTLNGHFDADLAGGALEGIDLRYQLGRAQALLTREAPPPRSDPPRTRFDAFKVSAQITNGVARTTDLTISSAALRVTGEGSANLVNKGLDLSMQASILNSQGASFADIPFKMGGTYVDPKISADMGALAKGQLKQKLQDVLERNGLKGLFSK
jgi:AsmA protein